MERIAAYKAGALVALAVKMRELGSAPLTADDLERIADRILLDAAVEDALAELVA
jgi:hypothetical protein